MKIKYEVSESGNCLTECQYVIGVSVGSMRCGLCQCNFGDDGEFVTCNADRVFKEVVNHDE